MIYSNFISSAYSHPRTLIRNSNVLRICIIGDQEFYHLIGTPVNHHRVIDSTNLQAVISNVRIRIYKMWLGEHTT